MVSLPQPIRSYFDANASFDIEGMVAPFAAHALVHDESRQHRGRHEIREWIAESTLKPRAVAVPTSVGAEYGKHCVIATVSGAFPGSPISLSFHFRLEGDEIAELKID